MLDGKVIATVERLGVVIGVVKDRRALLSQIRDPAFDTASTRTR
jgi:hypothetical protein